MAEKKDGTGHGKISDSEGIDLFDDIFKDGIDDTPPKSSSRKTQLDNRAQGKDSVCKLNIIKGPLKGHSFEIKGGITYIGRTGENDIVIDDRTISRRHLKIVKNNNQFFVVDLGSYNGLMVNGRLALIGDEIELTEGTEFEIGDSGFEVEILHSRKESK